MQQKLSSNDIREISATVARLMNHYWTAADPPAVRQAQLDDWLEDLVEFGPELVRLACVEWRQENSRRPTPADIRLLAIREQRRRAPPPLPPPPPPEFPPPTEAEKRAVSELVAQITRSLAAGGEA